VTVRSRSAESTAPARAARDSPKADSPKAA
jgi:hypothetical protein